MRGHGMKNTLVKDIADILMEKNYNIAAEKLERIVDLDGFGGKNFLHDIIMEERVTSPDDEPFAFAKAIWKNSCKVERNKALLKEILEYPIADINRAKINDFLWETEKDFTAAKSAEMHYRKHIETEEEFDYNLMAINRLIFISKKINSRNVDETARSELLTRVLEQYNNDDHGKILNLIQTAMSENVDVNYLIHYTEKILNTYSDKSTDFLIIGKLCDMLEQLKCMKNNWQRKKNVTEPELIEIRKRKTRAIQACSESITGNPYQKIQLLKEEVNILKTIPGTEDNKKGLLRKIDAMEKKLQSDMPVFSEEQDASWLVKHLISRLEALNKEEALCFFALSIPLPHRSQVEKSVIESAENSLVLGKIPIEVINNDGKPIAIRKPIKKSNGEFDPAALQNSIERKAAEFMGNFSRILIGNALNYIQSKFQYEENDIREIVENSKIVPEDRKEAYIKGIMAGFSRDFLTSLYILVPQAENSIRELAKICGEPIYNLNEDGTEELKTMHAILELEGIKDNLDEDFLLAIKTIFCSKFGFNMRNDIAHGLLSDEQSCSYQALYTWWFILKMCFMFYSK